jgi:hypothetical protein
MKESTIVRGTILLLGFLTIILIAFLDVPVKQTNTEISKTDSLEYYKALFQTYKDTYQEAILDPAVRMKMVMGMPKDSAITWARKCHYKLNIHALVKWRPDEQH